MKHLSKRIFSSFLYTISIVTASSFMHSINAQAVKVSLVYSDTSHPVQHGFDEIKKALEANHFTVERTGAVAQAAGKYIILGGINSGESESLAKAHRQALPQAKESLSIVRFTDGNKDVVVANGADERGLMYALLDIAEKISWSKSTSPFDAIKNISEKPDASERAVSIYTMNRAYWESRFYDDHYWEKYLDMLAKDRFNSLVIVFGYENGGFLAPCYPYFFDVNGFPDVNMTGLSAAAQKRNREALNKLIQTAHDRGVRITLAIWDHIYRGGVQGGGIPGADEAPDKPVEGLVWGLNENNLIPYTKAALRDFVTTFRGLDAIQFRMHNESGLKNSEQDAFWLDIFKMMKSLSPNLRLDLRAKELKETVIQSAIDVGIDFRITTKFWMEQMGLPFHPTMINPEPSPRRHTYSDLLRYPKKYNIHWRLWNGGTARILLFGDPEYVKRFGQAAHLYDGDGFEVNEMLATKMEAQPHDEKPFDLLNPAYRYYEYEFERYWHFYETFGRVGYNPNISPETWTHSFEQHFGSKAAPLLEQALHKASEVLPRIISSSYPYTSFPTTRGWAEKQSLGGLARYSRAQCTDLMQFATFDEEAALNIANGSTAKLLPSSNSRWFFETADSIEQYVKEASKAGDPNSKEFLSTIMDLKILTGLARYHANRIPAAVNYCIYQRTKSLQAYTAALDYERKAIDAWQQIVDAAGDMYNSDLKMGVCVSDLCGHWKDELAALKKDLQTLERANKDTMISNAVPVTALCKPALISNYSRLFTIAHEPVIKADTAKDLPIHIHIDNRSGIQSVTIRYRPVNQEMEWASLPMKAGIKAGDFEAVIPQTALDPHFDFQYLIEIIDKDKHGTIYPDLNKETPYVIVDLH